MFQKFVFIFAYTVSCNESKKIQNIRLEYYIHGLFFKINEIDIFIRTFKIPELFLVV